MVKFARVLVSVALLFASIAAARAATLDGAPPPFGSSQQEIRADDALEKAELYRRGTVTPTGITGTNDYVATSAPAVMALSQGLTVNITIPNTNTGPARFNLDGLGLAPLVKRDGSDFVYGELTAGQTYRASYVGTKWYIFDISRKPVIEVETLGAKADGSDDGARISAGLYARFNGLSTSQSTQTVDIHFRTNTTYTLTTAIVVRQQRLRFICNGATLDGANTAPYAFDITQDSSGNANTRGMVIGCGLTRFATNTIRARAANDWTFDGIRQWNNVNGFDIVGKSPIVNGLHSLNSGTAVKFQSAIVVGGGRINTINGQINSLLAYGTKEDGSANTNPGYCINLIDAQGTVISGGDCEVNPLGEIYVQSSLGTKIHRLYSEPASSSPFVLRQDNSSGTGLGLVSDASIYEDFFIAGGALKDFDILAGNGAYIGHHRLGTGNINIAAGVTGTLLYTNLGGIPGTLTDAGTSTQDMRDLGGLLAAKLPLAGGTMTGKITMATANAGGASFNVPAASTAPTAANEGDWWNISNRIHFQLGAQDNTVFTTVGAGFTNQTVNFQTSAAGSQLAAYPGTAPTSPSPGAIWNDGSDFSVRIGAATVKVRGVNTGDQTITLTGAVAGSGTGAISTTLSPPTSTVLGGVKSATAGANQFQTGIDTTGAPTFAQPSVANLTGLGTGEAGALGLVSNATGGHALVNGAITASNCLKWSATGVQDATAPCGTVTTASVVSANGFAGSVATPGTTPAFTISTSVNGIAKGNGTALSAATSGTDYAPGTAALATGIVKTTTTTGALSIANAGDFPTLNQSTTGNAATATTAGNVTGTVGIGNGGTGATNVAGATAALNAVVGDSGSGGTKGLVPAPAAGDAAAGKFLKADGTWFVPPGGGGGSPGGTSNQIQYNNGGAFGGFTASGDVSINPTSGATIIQPNVVDNTKAATMANGTLKCRTTAGTGNPEDCTAAQAANLLPAATSAQAGVVPTTGLITSSTSSTAPSGPTGSDLRVSPWKYSGMPALATISAGRGAEILQNSLGGNPIALWQPAGNSATVPGVLGMPAPTNVGTLTARTVATTSMATRIRRMGFVSAATAASLMSQYQTVAQYTSGTGTVGLGGFLYRVRFVQSDAAAVSGERTFIGLRNATAAPTNVEPSTLTNQVGVCQISTSNNLQICYGGSAASTPIDLGVNFPANTLSADAYELTLYSPSGVANEIDYRVERLGTANIAEGTLAGTAGTAFPANTTLLNHAAWKTNNATALAVGLDIGTIYIEQEN